MPKYDDKLRTWELALKSLEALGGVASVAEIKRQIVQIYPDFKTSNVGTDLAMLAVNCPGRVNHRGNKRLRRTDSGSEFDRAFRIGPGYYEIYDAARHGVWELYEEARTGKVVSRKVL